MKEFKLGDVVALKGTAVNVTVEEINLGADRDEVRCVWFNVAGNKLQRARFKNETIEKCEIKGE